ncbi:unnamed protein product [Gongylonema pulchrum]|uniref:Uncharacterized protein n=1 Tax=Gongylonema pulchrum TaxID=637853 RepID=A0A3P6QT85_9BILA|nr:unnamed protein product [Gongylonema pulchrum]
MTPKAIESSRRAGFDERLCYGDIVLGFRIFRIRRLRCAQVNPRRTPDDETRLATRKASTLSVADLWRNKAWWQNILIPPKKMLNYNLAPSQ